MAVIYVAAHRRAVADAIKALGNRIGLYVGSTRVGTVYADTTWGAAADYNDGTYDWARVIGSQVAITVPGGTLSNGSVIDYYGILNGSTLLRRVSLPYALTVADGSQAATVNVTPTIQIRGV